jgi:hypothetical protein
MGPSLVWSTPGASEMIRVSSRSRPLIISLSLPARSTIAVSGAAVEVIAFLTPSAIENTAIDTITTPATPTIVASEEPRRWGIVRRLTQVTVAT